MSKTIRTRYLGYTVHRSPRVVADDGDGNKVTVSAEYEDRIEEPHYQAVLELEKKMGWPKGEWIGQWYKNRMIWIDLKSQRRFIGSDLYDKLLTACEDGALLNTSEACGFPSVRKVAINCQAVVDRVKNKE